MRADFGSAWPIVRDAASAFRAPRRISVSQGAAAALVIRQPGGYSGPWSADETPYMVEPMDALASRAHEAVCFVGPSRSGKTMGLLDGWMAHAVCNDPGDMLVVQMSQDKAREYSKVRVDRAILHSPALHEQMSGSGHDDNTHDKLFKHGMWLKIGWPSSSQLSGSDYRYVALTDYDRMPDNIDGEADAFGLGLTRIRTFLSRGMCMVESSPGRDLADPYWSPATAHEGPPCTGVVGIYNRSDRRRLYWPCPHCGDYHQAKPGLELFATLPDERKLLETVRTADLDAMAREHARIVCPSCGAVIEARHKHDMNRAARWLIDGQQIDGFGRISGEPLRSNIAGFWLGGVSAVYQSWQKLILAHLQALREFAMTGSELPLQKTCNTDQAMPYLPRHLIADREGRIEDRKTEIPRFMVPNWARFLVATADVQGGSSGRFVCEVRAFGPHLESTLVDRFAITTTERKGVAAQVDPSGYPEDWDLLTAKLVTATYRLDDGREMRVLRTAVDTGGEAGTTPNAYAWYRRLRRAGLSARVMLVKGGSHQQEKPVVKGSARSNTGKPMHDMPVWIINTDYYKDIVAASLRRKVSGPGFFHAPDWLPQSWFDELKAETRDSKGKWKKLRARNEALDLWVYALAVCEALGFGAKGRLSWDSPPEWALPQSDANAEIIEREERRAEQAAASSADVTSTHASGEDLFAPIPMY